MGGCVKSEHYLRKSRHSQRKSRHWTCYGLAKHLLLLTRSKFDFLRERISCCCPNEIRKFLSIGSPAGKCWNKTKFPCKKCTDAPIIRREKWQTHKIRRKRSSYIQLRVFFSRIHKKSAYRHYVGTPIYDNLYGGC